MKNRRWMVPLIVAATLADVGGAAALFAKEKKDPTKLVRGHVVDENENQVPNATVKLTNLKTQVSRAVYTDDEGRYRFGRLKINEDYEVQAEHNGMASRVRRVSSFDNRKEIVYILRLSSSSP